MKTKTNKIISGITFLVVFSSGAYCGYLFSFWTSVNKVVVTSLRKEQFQNRIEGYQPTCDDLNANQPIIHSQENDYIAVFPSDTYFYVFAFNTEAGKPPMTSWWGAGIDEARRQECGGKYTAQPHNQPDW